MRLKEIAKIYQLQNYSNGYKKKKFKFKLIKINLQIIKIKIRIFYKKKKIGKLTMKIRVIAIIFYINNNK